MNKELQKKTDQWMQLERKTLGSVFLQCIIVCFYETLSQFFGA